MRLGFSPFSTLLLVLGLGLTQAPISAKSAQVTEVAVSYTHLTLPTKA